MARATSDRVYRVFEPGNGSLTATSVVVVVVVVVVVLVVIRFSKY